VGTVAASTDPLAARRAAIRTYRIADLGTLGGPSSEAAGLNNLGDVVGASATSSGAAHAFLSRGGRIADLGTLAGGTTSAATGINDAGLIVGTSGINAYGPQFQEFTQGFAWQDGSMRAVGALYCPCSFNVRYGTSAAFAVSNSGWIVGDSQTSRAALRHAFAWRENAMRDLGLLVDPQGSTFAYGVNDILEVVGAANGRAFLERDGVATDLAALPGYAASSARAVNNRGTAVGSVVDAAGASRAVMWDLGAIRDLGTLPGDAASQALAINADGEIAGRSGDTDFSHAHAVVWRDGVAIDLNRAFAGSAWTLLSATAINDVGQIAGVGVHNGERRAFLLSPD